MLRGDRYRACGTKASSSQSCPRASDLLASQGPIQGGPRPDGPPTSVPAQREIWKITEPTW